MVGGLGMARAAHVVDEKVSDIRRVVRRVSMVDRKLLACGCRSFGLSDGYDGGLTTADKSIYAS